jgi:membrane-associated protein
MDSQKLIQYGGLTLLVLIIFAETGLFIGFFLPGDYLLFTAGILCGTKDLNVNVFIVLSLVTIAAIVGYFAGYASGGWRGPDSSNVKTRFSSEKVTCRKQKYSSENMAHHRSLPAAFFL